MVCVRHLDLWSPLMHETNKFHQLFFSVTSASTPRLMPLVFHSRLHNAFMLHKIHAPQIITHPPSTQASEFKPHQNINPLMQPFQLLYQVSNILHTRSQPRANLLLHLFPNIQKPLNELPIHETERFCRLPFSVLERAVGVEI